MEDSNQYLSNIISFCTTGKFLDEHEGYKIDSGEWGYIDFEPEAEVARNVDAG